MVSLDTNELICIDNDVLPFFTAAPLGRLCETCGRWSHNKKLVEQKFSINKAIVVVVVKKNNVSLRASVAYIKPKTPE